MTTFDPNDPNVTVTIQRTEFIRNGRESQFSDGYRAPKASPSVVKKRPISIPSAVVEPIRYSAEGRPLKPSDHAIKQAWARSREYMAGKGGQEVPAAVLGHTHVLWFTVESRTDEADANVEADIALHQLGGRAFKDATVIGEHRVWTPNQVLKMYSHGPVGDPGTLTVFQVYAVETPENRERSRKLEKAEAKERRRAQRAERSILRRLKTLGSPSE